MEVKTFLVSIRKPPLNRLSWDYQKQVMAFDSEAALQLVQDNVNLDVSIEKCKVMIQVVPVVLTNRETKQNEYVEILENKLTELLGERICVFNSNSGLPYRIPYHQGKYRVDMMIKSDLKTGVPTVVDGHTFDFYQWLIMHCEYQLSLQNMSLMEAGDATSQKEIQQVIKTFESVGGVFSEPLPLGGKITDILFQCGDITKVSDTFVELKKALYQYRKVASEAYALHQQIAQALHHIQEIKNNISMFRQEEASLCKQNFGVTRRPLKVQKQGLVNNLQGATDSITMNMVIERCDKDTFGVSIEGQDVNTHILLDEIIQIQDDVHGELLLNECLHEDSSIRISINYDSITSIPIALKEIINSESRDCYDEMIMTDLIEENPVDSEGYYISKELASVFDNYKMLDSLAISAIPTIEIEITNPIETKVMHDFKIGKYVMITLLNAIKFGQVAYSLEVQAVEKGIEDNSLCIKIGQAKAYSDIPLEEKTAYIIGGTYKKKEMVEGSEEGTKQSISLTVPLAPNYENEEIVLTETSTVFTHYLKPGSQNIETPLLRVGQFKQGDKQQIFAKVSFHYRYNPDKQEVLLKDNDYVSKEATCISLFTESLECIAKIYCYYGKNCYSLMEHSYWQFDQSLSNKLLPQLQELVNNINASWISKIKENYLVSLQSAIPLTYKNAYLVFQNDQLVGFYDATKRQEYVASNCTILPFTSTYITNAVIKPTMSFVNVLKSTGDTPTNCPGYSWYGLWKYQCNGNNESRCVISGCPRTETDSTHMVGAHVLVGVAASRKATAGETVYILPLCKSHNSHTLTTPMSVGSDTLALQISYTPPK